MDSSVFDQPQFLLGTAITGSSRLAQEVLANTAIPGIATLATHQLPEAALRGHHPFAGWLLEQTSGEMFDIGVVTQPWTVEQPLGYTHRNAFRRGNTGRI
ncbi:hypothetical protein D3C73_997840 [compost metagenome]